jgi:hypothetical protein
MTTPEVIKCPDGHFRRAIYGLGPYIADYPEQVWLTSIVQNWCPKFVFVAYMILTTNPSSGAMQNHITSMLKVLGAGPMRKPTS